MTQSAHPAWSQTRLEEELPAPNPAATRQSLVRKLADILVLPAERLGYNERAFTADLLITTLSGMSKEMRTEVSARLARVPDLPSVMMRFLALEPAMIAKPLLTSISLIPEAILMEAAHVSAEHRQLIVRRDDVTGSVADILASFDELEVFVRLLRKPDITLSEQTLVRMLIRSQHELELREMLIRRPELRPEHGFIMFWWLSSAHRKVILSRFALDRTIIQDSLQELFPEAYAAEYPDPVVMKALKLIDRRHRPRGRNGEIISMDVVERTLAAALSAPSQDLTEVVGLIAGISPETSSRVLHDTSGEPFAILCKSIGISRGAFHNLFATAVHGGVDQVIDPSREEFLMAIFDTMSRDYARTVLRYWDWRNELQIAGVPHEDGGTHKLGQDLEDDSYLGAV